MAGQAYPDSIGPAKAPGTCAWHLNPGLISIAPSADDQGLMISGFGSGGFIGVSAARMDFCTVGLERFPR